jgi:DNA-binding SARP family transcriptional activator/Tfp pilus assembly protein PilF
MTATLRIHLLGPFEIFQEDKPISNADWHSQQTRTICKILLARQGDVVTTDQIIEILWPADDPDSARSRLHVRISQLRRALGKGKSCLKTVDGGYLFQPDESCWLDVDEFQTRISEASRFHEAGQQPAAILAYEQARQLYRGEFLAEDIYADWTFAAREHYRERFLTLLIELAESYAQQGRYRLALARTQEAQAYDPLREGIYVRLMLYHYYAGERPQALRAFERCRQVLAAELAVEPLESTHQLAEQIRAGTLWASAEAPHYPPPIYASRIFEVPYSLSEMPLVGREREYAWLVAQWQDPGCGVILLEGEAGIGKSRLAEVFTGYAATEGTRVLRTRLTSAERAPLAPLAAAMRPLLTETTLTHLKPAARAALCTLFPEIQESGGNLPCLPALPPEAERQRLYQAVADFAAAHTVPPTLLWVDDAHRMGAAAIELLARLTDSWQILLSYRSEETPPDHPLRRVFGEGAMQLEALEPGTIAALLRQLAGLEMPDLAAQINAQSGGQPLFIAALLQHLFETGQLYVDANGNWGQTGELRLTLPSTMRTAIESRLQRLPRGPRRIFDLIAVLGGEFDFGLLQAASGEPEETLLGGVDELITAALLVEPRRQGQPEFAVSHERYTEVAYATLPGVRRKQLHRLAAQAIETHYLENLNAYYPALAGHYDKAGNSVRAAHYATLAGEQAAAQFANTAALHFLGRALELTAIDDHAQRARLLLAREKIYDLQGVRPSQEDDLSNLEALAPHLRLHTQAEIALRRAAFEWIMGRDTTAETALIETIRLSQAANAHDLEARAYLLKGRAAKEQSLAQQYLAEALQLAQKTAQRALEGEIVRALGNACFWQGRYAESQTYFEKALAIHKEVGDTRGELSALNNLGQVMQLLGKPTKATQFFSQALAASRKIGDQLAEGVLLTNQGGLLLLLGNFEQAQTDLALAVKIRQQIANEEGAAMALKLLGDVSRQQGQYAQANAYYEQALEIAVRLQLPRQRGESLAGLAALYRDLGAYARAEKYLEQALAALPEDETASRLRAFSLGCSLNYLSGNPTQAQALGELAVAQSEDFSAILAEALTNLGQVLAQVGQTGTARQHFMRALEIRQELGQMHLTAESRAGLAQAALAQDDLDAALSQAAAIWQLCESNPLWGVERPLWVYLTCYRVFQCVGDPRARNVLSAAKTRLRERAANIESDELRATYLEDVPENREIDQLYRDLQ